jgi:two-component system response regulator (stage 0 sporulation protein F)
VSVQARVLIIDDKKLVRDTVRDALYDFNCVIAEAQDGSAALTLLEAFQPDVIILDLKLQDMSGLDVMIAGHHRCVIRGKVIVLTGLPEPWTREQAETLGVFAYLTKPINWTELRRTVAEAIPESAPLVSTGVKPVLEEVLPRVLPPPRRRSQGLDMRRRILVLDDDVKWLDTVRDLLGNDFNLTLTISAREAIRHVRRNGYALVLLDKNLPNGASGLDVLDEMRRAVPGVRAIVMTEDPDKYSLMDSVLRGAVDYVEKSESRNLNDTVHRILSEPREQIRVFLSYVKADRPKVLRLHKKLTQRGFLPWMDCKNITGGRWKPQIHKQIATTDYFLFCLSSHSINKEEGVINEEVHLALERQSRMREETIFFVIGRLEDCDVTEPFREFQYFDVFRSSGFTRLVSALGHKDRKPR